MLVRHLIKFSSAKLNAKQLEDATEAQMKRLKIQGLKLDGVEKKTFLLFIDPEAAKRMPHGLSKLERAKWLSKTIRTPGQMEELNISKWGAKVRGGFTGTLPFAFGALALLAQFAALSSLQEKQSGAMQQEKAELNNRLWAQRAQMAGAIGDVLAVGMGALVKTVPKLGAGFGLVGAKTALKFTGQFLGVGGSLLMAIYDIYRGLEEVEAGNYGAGAAYLVSGALGIAATILIFIGWTGVGLILVGLIVAISIIIALVTDNKIQEWLKRIYRWGKLIDQRYPNLDTEQSELRKALAA